MAPENFRLTPGRSIQSPSGAWYRIIQPLGFGGNAVTYLVVATSGPFQGVLFALKFFRKLSSPERQEVFLRETEFLKNVNHPSIMRVFDDGTFEFQVDGELNSFPFVVAEYLPNTLYEIGHISLAQKISCALQLLSALVYLDGLEPKVVHRDIKPQNIFLKGKACVLGDFGLMKAVGQDVDADREVFKESTGPGMPRFYRTPDLVAYARNEADLTTKSDTFQLGLVLAELFTGRNPLKAPANGDMLSPVDLHQLSWIDGKYGADIAAKINRMLRIDPVTRPGAQEVFNAWGMLFTTVCADIVDIEGKVFS